MTSLESYWCVLTTVVGEGLMELTPGSVCRVCVCQKKTARARPNI